MDHDQRPHQEHSEASFEAPDTAPCATLPSDSPRASSDESVGATRIGYKEKDFTPLSSNPTGTPVLLIDSSRPFADLYECASQRLRAADGLMHSMACLNLELADGRDVQAIVETTSLLLRDGIDILAAANVAARRESRAH